MSLTIEMVRELRDQARKDMEAYGREVFGPYLDDVAFLHAAGIYDDQSAANAIRDRFGMNCSVNGVTSKP